MNKKQIIVLWIGITSIVIMGIYPPWFYEKPFGALTNPILVRSSAGYSWLWSPPSFTTRLAAPRGTAFSANCAGIILRTRVASSNAHSLTVFFNGSISTDPAISIPPPITTTCGLNKFTKNATFFPSFSPAWANNSRASLSF